MTHGVKGKHVLLLLLGLEGLKDSCNFLQDINFVNGGRTVFSESNLKSRNGRKRPDSKEEGGGWVMGI